MARGQYDSKRYGLAPGALYVSICRARAFGLLLGAITSHITGGLKPAARDTRLRRCCRRRSELAQLHTPSYESVAAGSASIDRRKHGCGRYELTRSVLYASGCCTRALVLASWASLAWFGRLLVRPSSLDGTWTQAISTVVMDGQTRSTVWST